VYEFDKEVPAPAPEVTERVSLFLESIRDIAPIRAVLLFGSARLSLFSHENDIDLLCLTTTIKNRQILRRIAGVYVDAFFCNVDHLETAIRQRVIGNNNFLLNAFTTGLVLSDTPDRLLHRFMKIADDLRRRGPDPLEPELQKRLLFSVGKLWVSFTKAGARQFGETASLARCEADSAFSQIVDIYFLLANLWGGRLRWIGSNADPRYAFVRSAVLGYFGSHTEQERAEVVGAFVRSIRADYT